eukprot:Sspe_Gene.59824::Locus_32894_Transcript_1_1_Confidence_1.000_Length_1654::g.59824::m.59824
MDLIPSPVDELFFTASPEEKQKEEGWMSLLRAFGPRLRYNRSCLSGAVDDHADVLRMWAVQAATTPTFGAVAVKRVHRAVRTIQRAVRKWQAEFSAERNEIVEEWKLRERLATPSSTQRRYTLHVASKGRSYEHVCVQDATKPMAVRALWNGHRAEWVASWRAYAADNADEVKRLTEKCRRLRKQLAGPWRMDGGVLDELVEAAVDLRMVWKGAPQWNAKGIHHDALVAQALQLEDRVLGKNAIITRGVLALVQGRRAIRSSSVVHNVAEMLASADGDNNGVLDHSEITTFLASLHAFTSPGSPPPAQHDLRNQASLVLRQCNCSGSARVEDICGFLKASPQWSRTLRLRGEEEEPIPVGPRGRNSDSTLRCRVPSLPFARRESVISSPSTTSPRDSPSRIRALRSPGSRHSLRKHSSLVVSPRPPPADGIRHRGSMGILSPRPPTKHSPPIKYSRTDSVGSSQGLSHTSSTDESVTARAPARRRLRISSLKPANDVSLGEVGNTSEEETLPSPLRCLY